MPTLPKDMTLEDGDPLPEVGGFRIVGHPVLGGRLTACGHSIHGTSLCMFQWVRHCQDGTMMYIEGATQPEYTITADDVETLMSVECVPMDDRNRQGPLVSAFANDARYITCDPFTRDQLERYSSTAHASFEVKLLVGGNGEDEWKSASLTLKQNGYELVSTGHQRNVVVWEQYSPAVLIEIPSEHLKRCVIKSQERRSYHLKFPDSRSRDVGILTFRLFQKMSLGESRSLGENLSYHNTNGIGHRGPAFFDQGGERDRPIRATRSARW